MPLAEEAQEAAAAAEDLPAPAHAAQEALPVVLAPAQAQEAEDLPHLPLAAEEAEASEETQAAEATTAPALRN